MFTGKQLRTANIMQFKRLWSVLAAVLVAVTSPVAFGHPGHGTTEPSSPAHAAEPVHLLPIVLGVIAATTVSVFAVRRMKLNRVKK